MIIRIFSNLSSNVELDERFENKKELEVII